MGAERRVCVALLVLLGACGDDVPPPPTPGFEHQAGGIDFEMRFLSGEQGENFKINLYDHGSGVSVADYDGDGDDDIYFLNQLGSNALYRNNGDGTFTDVTAAAGPLALDDRICTAAAFNDIDNDGDQDLFVTSTRGGNALFRNEGGGRFVEVTEEAGVALVAHSQGGFFFDADNDGDLDLFVTNTAQWTTRTFDAKGRYYEGAPNLGALIDSPIEFNVFYLNDGKGRFTEATDAARLRGVGWGGDAAIFDYDEDGDLDLFVGNMFGRSAFYRNDGKGRFEEAPRDVLGKSPWGTVGAKAFDYDSDGRLDLFVVDMHSDMWMPFDYDSALYEETKKYPGFYGRLLEDPEFPRHKETAFAARTRIRYELVFFGNGLFRNTGRGTFEEVSDAAGAETLWPWGVATGDFDNDGHEDAYLPSGMGFPFVYWRSPLLMNDGDGTFTDCSRSAGVDPPPGGETLGFKLRDRDATRSSRSAAVADFDGDGRLDLVVNNFNDRPFLYRNRWPRRNYVAFRLRGRRSNRDAVGALVRVHVGERVMVRQVHAAGGYLAQSSKTLHFGLGDAKTIDRCEVRWPSGTVQVLRNPTPNRFHEVVEPNE